MRSKHLKWGLLAVIAVTVGAMVWAFVNHRQSMKRRPVVIDQIDQDADMKLGKVRQTATRDGVKEWDLVAGSAKYHDDRKQVVFEDMAVTFFLKDQQEVTMTADTGTLETDSKNMEAIGNVVIKNQGYRLETEALSYRHDNQVVCSDAPVVISGDTFRMTADSLFIDLNTQEAELDGRVNGSFYGNIAL